MSEKQSSNEQIVDKSESEHIDYKAEDVTRSVSLLDSWFVRCCWTYKKDFLFRCLDHFCKEGLEQVVLLLGPPIKDYYYSLSGYTNNLDDITPQDDNRQMDEDVLNNAREADLVWLLSIPKQQAINILIGLTELSGSALRMQLYERALSLLKALETHETDQEESQTPVKEKYGFPQDVNKDSKEYHVFKANLDKYTHFIDKLKSKLNAHQEDKKNNQKKSGKGDQNNKNQEALDYLQILPSWINRQVLSYLDEESLNKCQKVNSYWKNAVKELQKERETRNKIDDLITKLSTDKENVKSGKGEKGDKNKKTPSTKHSEESKKASQKKTSARISEVEKRISMLPHSEEDTLEMIGKFTKSKDRLAFHRQHLLVWTLDEYTESRVLALGKRWLAFSRAGTIVLCNLITFANLPGIMKGHEGGITAMAFHPEEGHLISAGTDSTVRRWEVWSRQELHSFSFPNAKEIKANENYYAVAGLNIIKVFLWELNVCKCSVELDELSCINTMVISSDQTIYISYSPENTVRRFCAKNGVTIWEMQKTQCSRITCMHQKNAYLVTGNEEGWITVWKPTETELIMLATKNLSKKVNDVLLHKGCVITASETGELIIWDIATDELVQTLAINEDAMPLLDLLLINYYDHCKVIVNSEMGIKVLQFFYKRTHLKKTGFISPQTYRFLPDALTSSEKLIVMRDTKKGNQMKEQLIKRQSCHPNLRKDHKTVLTIKDSSEYLMRQDIGDLRYFPTIYGDWSKPLVEFQDVDNQDSNTFKYKTVRPSNQITNLTNLLPIHNPYKHKL